MTDINLKDWRKVKRLEFKRYKIVQKSGVTNMLSLDVEVLANIDAETHSAIIQNYGKLERKFGRNFRKETSSIDDEITSQDIESLKNKFKEYTKL